MLTLFTTAKLFQGHKGTLQRDATSGWTCLDPDVEVILFGGDPGAEKVCGGARHTAQEGRGIACPNRL